MIRIPRADIAQTAETVAPEAVPLNNDALNNVGRQLGQLGEQMRKTQVTRDIAEAETRIYAARKAAQATAEEQGMYGEQYQRFMSDAVRKARSDVMGLTELPEAKRYLENEGMVKQQADEIQFQAEGMRKQIENDNARIQRGMEINGNAAQIEFHWTGNDFTEDAYQLADNARMLAQSRFGLSEGEADEQGLNASSTILFTAGSEVIEGYTRNGNGDPYGLLKMLVDDEGNILDNKLTRNMTSDHVWRLKNLAEAKMREVATRSNTIKEAITERLDEWNSNIKTKVDGGGYVTPRELDEGRRLYQRLNQIYQVDARIEQWPDRYKLDPDKQERARRTQMEFLENTKLMDAQEAAVVMTNQELEASKIALERRQNQVVLAGDLPQDDAVMGDDGTLQQTGEFQETRMQLAAVRAEEERRREARRTGETLKDYIKKIGGDPAAALDVDFTDMEQAYQIAQVRVGELEGASKWAGYPAPLFTSAEVKEFTDRISEGGIQPQELTAWVGLMSELPEENAREQMRLFDKHAPWMRGMMFSMEIGNSTVSEQVAKGANIVLTGGAKEFWSAEGDDEAVRAEFSALFRNTFVSNPMVGQDLTETAMLYAYGTAEKMSGNSAGDFDAEALAKQIFPGGADVVEGRLFPRPSSTVEEDLTAAEVLADLDYRDFNGYVLDRIKMDDAVSDDMAGASGERLLLERIRDMDDDIILEPDPSRPGEYYVLSANPADGAFMNQEGYFLNSDNRPLRLNLNNFYERRRHTMDMTDAERQRRGIERYYEMETAPAGAERRRNR